MRAGALPRGSGTDVERSEPNNLHRTRGTMEHIALLALAFMLLVGGAEYFTNAIEWLGRRLKLSDSATGSLLAAVGTAMPETLVPIVAIFFVSSEASHEVGIGGILGAPFMLSTLAMLVIGTSLWAFRRRRMTTDLQFNPETASSDLQFFLIAYGLAFAAALIPPDVHVVRWTIAAALIPLYVIYMSRLLRTTSEPSSEELRPLHVIAHLPTNMLPYPNWAANPGLGSIVLQVVLALGLIIGGAQLFVREVEFIAAIVGLAPIVMSLLITPLATELPEKLNSVIWIMRRKDTLAFGNMSGAMVFQSAFPVTIGILFTEWSLSLNPSSPTFLPALSCVLALLSGTSLFFFVRRHDTLHLPHLLASGSLYFVFVVAVVITTVNGLAAPSPTAR
ncbi:MAG: sodium:calcium antiporter [Chloroflexi bacterium]|nr:sodium:calcium antiporter [Chloroflexota bacterium]